MKNKQNFPLYLIVFGFILFILFPTMGVMYFFITILIIKSKAKNLTPAFLNSSLNTSETSVPTKIQEGTVEDIYLQDEAHLFKNIINEELVKNNYDKNVTIEYVEKRKMILTIIFSILNLIFISFYFFHLPIWTYIFLIINIFIYIKYVRKFDLIDYLIKQIKGRPDDDVSDIISSIVQDKTTNKFIYRLAIIGVSILLPFIIFNKPRLYYEKADGGYYVRFYTIGLKNNEVVEIPETYKGKSVIGIRGNVFANAKKLKEVKLPNSIKTIRGRAFKNDINLEKINLPSELTYLGGSAFKNCRKLKNITIPSGVKEINGSTFEGCTNLENIYLHDDIIDIHGSAFRNCKSLTQITLPSKITEIHGNTFENCSSLQKIEIPDSVTRIGGHAFYGASLLNEVKFSENSNLNEIGSSAFRKCYSLLEITLPDQYIYINERAFKESPTNIKYFSYNSIYNTNNINFNTINNNS